MSGEGSGSIVKLQLDESSSVPAKKKNRPEEQGGYVTNTSLNN